jgi:hypothetical protein
MATPTDIANRALQKLGSSRIMSIDDLARNAQEARGCYEILRDAELRRHPWSFAIGRQALAAQDAPPAWGAAFAYPLPADCLRLVEVEGADAWDGQDYRGGAGPAWRIEDAKVVTDLPAPLNVRYVRREPDATRFDPCFVEVLACRMAAEMAEALTQSSGKRQLALAEYKDAVGQARRLNAIETAPERAPDDAWLMGRL